ncbi:Uma2 family endonuclease [Leptolyngbya cf. ectocarpi LEGE 11479]|uniref:Uma2 family endonuclease n=1 Tax=Leptolyngbya cf. ectocarpi LEGE 11479 TaxID=1828722 RepID=A0A928ZXX1_LEPEC|nr:Uma2 family endonuclease [Leptolyngbya ectocarpi]MBE9069477.1 Uma2 family endonuclease [Leptolyngbya cf. ectocarpi LEGE 11479]
MVQQVISDSHIPEQYPDSDGQPMADNTKQFRWIVVIKENLERLFANDANVFIAGDLLWYPVEGEPKRRQAPDVMVVLGRPKGDRGSYRQWLEDDIAPQVVFEILSPGNRPGEMLRKLNFYQKYGVEEYYIYDPDDNELTGFERSAKALHLVSEMRGWVSPILGIRFELTEETLEIYRPDGEQFLTYVELGELLEAERKLRQADQQQLTAERELRQTDQQRIQALEEKLRELGINPESL